MNKRLSIRERNLRCPIDKACWIGDGPTKYGIYFTPPFPSKRLWLGVRAESAEAAMAKFEWAAGFLGGKPTHACIARYSSKMRDPLRGVAL